jgi:hypothetical protein
MFESYFTRGTQNTRTGAQIGLEVETDFVDQDGRPITTGVTSQLLAAAEGRPAYCTQKLELGRQKVELAIDPQASAALAIEATLESLAWLYRQAERLGAYPLAVPEIDTSEDLLWVQEDRDQIWVELDGRPALEQLCRCSSVQFTVDVHPGDAIGWINQLWGNRLDLLDYAPNHARWQAYMATSRAGYTPDRYAGPAGFESLEHYSSELVRHPVVMHHGQPSWRPTSELADLNPELFLRSVWWHYRLRRYGNRLALEIRPIARRADDQIAVAWSVVSNILGL